MYARTNGCYNERGYNTNYVCSSIPHCIKDFAGYGNGVIWGYIWIFGRNDGGKAAQWVVAYGYFDGSWSRTSASDNQSLQITRTERCIFRCGDFRNYVQEDTTRRTSDELGLVRAVRGVVQHLCLSLARIERPASCDPWLLPAALECSSQRATKSIWSWILMFGVRHLGCHMCSAPSSPRLDVNTNSLLSPYFP